MRTLCVKDLMSILISTHLNNRKHNFNLLCGFPKDGQYSPVYTKVINLRKND